MLRSVSHHLEPAYGAFTRSQALDEQVGLIVTNRLQWPMTDHPIDADAAKLWLDDPALDRIIAEVGETITKPDRDVLRHDLLIC
jgi:hypothetical protein